MTTTESATTDDIATIRAEADVLEQQARQARAALNAREEQLHREREQRLHDHNVQHLHRLLNEDVPAADRERTAAVADLEQVLTTDPLGAALLRVLTSFMRWRALTVEAAGTAAVVGAPVPPTAAMQIAPDLLALLATTAQRMAKQAVDEEQQRTRAQRETEALDAGRLPTRPVPDHVQEMQAERRRTWEDQRLQTLLKLTPDEVAALDPQQRAAKLAQATTEEEDRQRKARRDFRVQAELDRARR